jgi:hypothetical protein
VGAGVDQFGGSSSSVVACFTPCIQCFPLPARDPDEYSFLMTSDLSLGGGVLELAVEKLSHGQSPLRMQQPPCPIHTPYTTLHGALASHLLDGFSPHRETTRHIHRPRASSTPTAHHHRWQLLPFPHGPIALAADPGSSEPAYAPSVCLRVTSAPEPSYVGRRTSYTLSQQRGACRA